MVNKRSIIISLVLITVVAIGAFFYLTNRPESSSPSQQTNDSVEVFYEKIPGSKNHSPDATWWGYNMSKIARFGNIVFMYVVHNDDDPATPSKFTIYKKEGEGPWEKGAEFPASRPGNILVDSKGVLHAFVFEAIDMEENDSYGVLKHYWFPKAKAGDIKSYKEELVAGPKENTENVNIRIGAAIGLDDTMAVAWGLTDVHLYPGHSEHVYYKKPNEKKWKHSIAGINLGHDWYYPFVLVFSKNKYYLLPVQDDYVEPPPDQPNAYSNLYQMIMYMEFASDKWSKEIIADLSNHALATGRYRLLEQSDLYEDKKGSIHIIYKETLDPDEDYKVTNFKHIIRKNGKFDIKSLDLTDKNISWIRLIEVDNILYYIATSFDELFIGKVDSGKLRKIDIPNDSKAIYPYITAPKTGTRDTESVVDVLLLNGESRTYPNAANLYVRIPKIEFSKIQ